MVANSWKRRMRGWVEVELSGRFTERFLNLCMKKNIYLWDVKRRGETLFCSMSVAGFRMIRPFAQKTKTKVHIREKHGLPFFVRRYKKRYFFIPGIFLFCFLVIFLSSFVWTVEIVGLSRVEEAEVREVLKDAGLYPGARKSNINPMEVQRKVLLSTDDIVWIWTDIRGVRAYVEVKESTPIPEMVPLDEPCNIVAAEDGVVTQMTVKEGQAVVKEGDAVAKGDLLVSGVMDSSLSAGRLVHALGSVKATVWVEKSMEIPLWEEVRTSSGNVRKENTVKFLNFSINLFRNGRNNYENYDKITTIKPMTIFGWKTPISIKTCEYQEMTVERKPISQEEATEKAVRVLDREMMQDLEDAEIMDRQTQVEALPNGNINVIRRIEANREIGMSVPMREE